MPNDPFRKPQEGEPLALSARTFSRVAEAAQAYQRVKLGGSLNAPGTGEVDNSNEGAVYALIQNTGGSTLASHSIQWYGPATIDPDPSVLIGNDFAVQAKPAFAGQTPAGAGSGTGATEADPTRPFCVTIGPIVAGAFGRAVVAGVAVCKILFSDPTHTRAVVTAGVSDYLVSAATGGVAILGHETIGSGAVYGQVLIGDQLPGPTFVRCLSTTPADGSAVGSECYEAIITQTGASLSVFPDGGTVWLTVLEDGVAVVPDSNQQYMGVLAGEVTVGGLTLPRVFAASLGSPIWCGSEGLLSASLVNGSVVAPVVLAIPPNSGNVVIRSNVTMNLAGNSTSQPQGSVIGTAQIVLVGSDGCTIINTLGTPRTVVRGQYTYSNVYPATTLAFVIAYTGDYVGLLSGNNSPTYEATAPLEAVLGNAPFIQYVGVKLAVETIQPSSNLSWCQLSAAKVWLDYMPVAMLCTPLTPSCGSGSGSGSGSPPPPPPPPPPGVNCTGCSLIGNSAVLTIPDGPNAGSYPSSGTWANFAGTSVIFWNSVPTLNGAQGMTADCFSSPSGLVEINVSTFTQYTGTTITCGPPTVMSFTGAAFGSTGNVTITT